MSLRRAFVAEDEDSQDVPVHRKSPIHLTAGDVELIIPFYQV